MLFGLLMVPLPSAVQRSWLLPVLEDAFHGPLFAAAACLILWLLRDTPWRGYLGAGLVAVAVALLSEVMQAMGSRDPSWHDVCTDLAGISGGLAMYALVFEGLSVGRRIALIAILLAAITWVLYPVAISIAAWHDREQRFPVLFDADLTGALGMTESMTDDRDVHIRLGNGAVDVELLAGPLPGLVVRGFVADWRGYRRLVIEIENPGPQAMRMETHIRDWVGSDARDDRFNAVREVAPGRSALRFDLADIEAGPVGRKLHLDEMMIIALYRPEPARGSFAIRSIRLE